MIITSSLKVANRSIASWGSFSCAASLEQSIPTVHRPLLRQMIVSSDLSC